jgi:hypothetical protein
MECRSGSSFSEDANGNSVPEPSFPGTGINNFAPTNFWSLCIPEPIFFRKTAMNQDLIQNATASQKYMNKGLIVNTEAMDSN